MKSYGWRARMQTRLNARWYGDATPGPVLRQLAVAYGAIADARALRLKRQAGPLPLPVVVVGNITAGGAGKTPVTLALVALAREAGLRVGIVSRGFGARGGEAPHLLRPDRDRACEVGDEPLMLARLSGVPVCIARKRADGIRALHHSRALDLVLADDGLQHYDMRRSAEICVVDGARGLGNGWRLPAGPLREPSDRLDGCDLVIINGAGAPGEALTARHNAARVSLVLVSARNIRSGEERPLAAFAGEKVRAMAGIAHPQRFFDALAEQGLDVDGYALADHGGAPHALLAANAGTPLLMTEKDAVKLAEAPAQAWAVTTSLQWLDDGADRATRLLRGVVHDFAE